MTHKSDVFISLYDTNKLYLCIKRYCLCGYSNRRTDLVLSMTQKKYYLFWLKPSVLYPL